MRLASLFQTVGVEEYALSACADQGIEVTRFHSLTAALVALRQQGFDGIILEDLESETSHWLAALRLRVGREMPIAVFGSGGAAPIARALQMGATEYATHAEGPKSLTARLAARLQFGQSHPPARWLKAGECRLDSASHCVSMDEQELVLTACEFGLAWVLFKHAGQVVSCNTLSHEVWGRSSEVGKRSIEQHVYRLRRKLQTLGVALQGAPRIHTVYGVGYRLQVPSVS